MFRFAPVDVGRNRLRFEAGKEPLQMSDEERRVERRVRGIARGAGDDQSFPGARGSDVGIVAFVAQLLPLVGAQPQVARDQRVTLGFTQQRRRRRFGRENALVPAGEDGELQFGIAGAVKGANQHLVECGRDYSDRQIGQTGFEDLQPFRERKRLVRECQLHIVQQRSHLIEHGRVDGEGKQRRQIDPGAPGFKLLLDAQGTP